MSGDSGALRTLIVKSKLAAVFAQSKFTRFGAVSTFLLPIGSNIPKGVR